MTLRVSCMFVLSLGLAACTSTRPPAAPTSLASEPPTQPTRAPTTAPAVSLVSSHPATGPGRGLPEPSAWLVYYGQPEGLGDLAVLATRYQLFVLQAGAFSAAQIATLQAQGHNRVLAYLDVGSVEHSASWWASAPAGFVPASKAVAAQLGPYGGYPDETWMDPSDAAWHHLLIDHIAPLALASGADGFFLDNLELVTHGKAATDGPCDDACTSGGLELIYALRTKYPDRPLLQNNATAEAVRTAQVHGVSYPSLLDGVIRESVFTRAEASADASDASYSVAADEGAIAELTAWKSLALTAGTSPFFLGTLDFINTCTNQAAATQVAKLARARGFSPAVSDKSASLQVVCTPP